VRRLPEPPDVLAPHPGPRWRFVQFEPLRVEVLERHRRRRRDPRNPLRPLRVRLAQPRLRDDAVVVGMVGVDEYGDGDAVLLRPPQKTLECLEAFVAVLACGNRSLSGVLLQPPSARNNPSHIHQGGADSDQGDSDQQQVAAA